MNISKLKIVLIGGGTGNAVLLRVLKKYTENITAIVTVADDGGSSGNLRDEMGIIAPGDIRNCLVALAEEESIMASLMDLRFTEGFIKKQSLGNIILAGMNKICGNFPLSVKYISEVLAIKGQVLPVTTENIILSAKLSNGKIINGESKKGNIVPNGTENRKNQHHSARGESFRRMPDGNRRGRHYRLQSGKPVHVVDTQLSG
jgi:uncharacterized cofD-like protein